MIKHVNNGRCPRCAAIIDRYPKFSLGLRKWFEDFQLEVPEAHVSCAGRGRQDQEDAFLKKVSKARYGESAHNAGAALDIFEMSGDVSNIYERKFYEEQLRPRLRSWIRWYGAPGAPFPELCHVEVKNWKELLAKGELSLVEAG